MTSTSTQGRTLAPAVIAAAVLSASAASAATTVVTFNFELGSSSVAAGSFSYNSADTGVISFADLSSFNIAFPGANSYDLGFVNSGNDTVYRYLGFDTGTDTFVSQTIASFPEILSDIKNGYNDGFFLRNDAFKIVRDYGPNGSQSSYDTLLINVSSGAPEPAAWGLMLLGLGGMGAALRLARRKAPAAA